MHPLIKISFILTILFLSGSACSSRKKDFSIGKIPPNWNLGEIRSAVVDVLSFYGPVKISKKNRFQSSRIPTNHMENLGREFTLVTVKVDGNHPHKIFISSAVFVIAPKGFKMAGKNPFLEKFVLDRVHAKLQVNRDLNDPTLVY